MSAKGCADKPSKGLNEEGEGVGLTPDCSRAFTRDGPEAAPHRLQMKRVVCDDERRVGRRRSGGVLANRFKRDESSLREQMGTT